MKDQTRVIAALLIGAAAGAALGLLLAPEKGETVRDGIADYINDLVDNAKQKAAAKASEIKQYGNDLYGKAKSTINEAISQEVKHEAQRRFNEGKSKVKNGSNDVNDAIQKA
jgi:gas vesicle protein